MGETDLGPAVLRVESPERQEDRSRDLAEQNWKGLEDNAPLSLADTRLTPGMAFSS